MAVVVDVTVVVAGICEPSGPIRASCGVEPTSAPKSIGTESIGSSIVEPDVGSDAAMPLCASTVVTPNAAPAAAAVIIVATMTAERRKVAPNGARQRIG